MQRRTFLGLTTSALLTDPLRRLPALDLPVGPLQLVRDGVGYYVKRGGTVGFYFPVNSGDGGAIVDTQFPDSIQPIQAELFQRGIDLDLLINTHHHGDHTGGNGVIAPLAKQYVTHERAKQNLIDSLERSGKTGKLPLPNLTFEKGYTLPLAGGRETVTARHFGPAHTGGDVVVHFENANVAHLGDLLFNRRFPYIDVGAGGDIINWASVMRKIRKHYDRNTIFLFGHAAESFAVTGNQNDLKAFETYLHALRDYVRKEKRSGTSLEQLKAKTFTVPKAPGWRYGERLRDINLEVMYEAV